MERRNLRHSDLPFVWNAPVLQRQRTAVSAAVSWSQKQNLEKPPVRWVSGEEEENETI